jgi:L-fucose mutarotase
MLLGVDPLLSGELLMHLDAMGHSDAVAVVDAHFPAHRVGQRVIDLPGTPSPAVLAAVRSVLPPDDAPALDLMTSADGQRLPVQDELIAAAQLTLGETQFVDRFAYYDVAEQAYVVIRTGETRTYGNALFRKGLVGA